MAKKMRKLTALVLALVLVASQLAMPSVAAESGTEPAPQTFAPSSVDYDPSTGTTTTTYTQESTDPNTGTTTVTTTVQTSTNHTDADTGVTTTGTGTSTEKTETSGGGAHMESSTNDSSKSLTAYPDVNGTTGTNGETDVNTKKETEETSNGSSSLIVDTQPVDADTQKTTVSDSGQQETNTTTTTTTTETTEDVPTGKDGENPSDVDIVENDPTKPGSVTDVPNGDTTTDPEWKEGERSEVSDWTDVSTNEVSSETTTGQTQQHENVELNNPDPNLTLALTPGSGWVQSTVELSTKNLMDGAYPQILDPTTFRGTVNETDNGWTITQADGTTTEVTVTPKTSADGLAGWEITTVTTTVGNRKDDGNGESVTDEKEVKTTSKFLTSETMEQEVAKGTQYSKNDKGDDVQTTVEKITDANGNFEGYRTVEDTITVEESGPVFTDIDPASDLYKEYYNQETREEHGFTPVANVPQAQAATKNADGTETTILVEPIYPDANSEYVTKYGVSVTTPIGYKVTKTTTGPDNMSQMEERQVYGTTYSKTTVTTTDPKTLQTHTVITRTDRQIKNEYTSELTREMDLTIGKTEHYNSTIVTESDNYQLISTAAGDFFLYQGKMYAVQGGNTLKESFDIASGDTVNTDNDDYTGANDLRLDGLIGKDENGNDREMTDHYTGQIFNNTTGTSTQWGHAGYGLYSQYVAQDDDGGAHTLKQFMLKQGDEIRYVYCVELGTNIRYGSNYTQVEYDADDDQSVKPWNDAEGNVAQIHSVAQNGFWGTQEGLGSLQAVKDLMTRNGLKDQADILTEGMAVAATQLAVWEFATSGTKFTGDYLTYDDMAGSAPNEADTEAITSLRDLLVRLAKSTDGQGKVDIIDENSITGGSITIEEEVIDQNTGKAKEDASGNKAYKGAVGFMLDVSTSSINGDLVVEISQGGKVLKKVRLAGNDQMSLTGLVTERIHPDENGNYTVEGLELFENQKITLNLNGIQHLEDGIYLYQSASWQDFVGLSTLENEVDLTVEMEFNVEDPEFTYTSTSATENRIDAVQSTGKSSRTDTAIVVRTHLQEQDLSQETRNMYILSTITKVETLEEKTKEKLRWENYYEYLLTTINDEDGGNKTNEDGGEELVILDEEVPLAAAPKTGDSTMMWALITMLALAGAAALSITPKRKVR